MNGDGGASSPSSRSLFGWQVQPATAAGKIEPLPERLAAACGTASEEGEWV